MSKNVAFFTNCEGCKAVIDQRQRYRAAHLRFCSRECYQKSLKVSGGFLKCKFCGKEYFVPTYRLEKSNFCSRRCSMLGNKSVTEPARLKAIRGKPAHNRIDPELKKAKDAFLDNRATAKYRGIGFNFTFDEWHKLWLDSGHWHERGKRKGQYCLARFGDQGAYELGNVKICTTDENSKERKCRPGNQRLSEDDVRRIRSLDGKIKRKLIAEEYGIDYWHVRDIQKRRCWEHVK